MIQFLQKPYTEEEVLNILNPVVKKWFFSKFKSFSLPQLYGVMEIHKRNNILVSAPTGATKTLTAFLSILNELVDSSEKGILENKIYCVYISPLKALNQDIQINLKNPLSEIEELSEKKHGIRVAVRTGDTTVSEKAAMLRNAPHVIITTPESLAILLSSSKFVDHLKDVQWCIIDEIHALADSKRGVHLSLSLERLAKLSPAMTRIGLSATVSPLEEIAKFLVGYEDGKERPCKIVDVQFIKELDLKVISPVKNMINVTQDEIHTELYNLLDKLIQEHKTTLIFTNTRSATERVVDNLKYLFPKNYTGENIGAHHGSLSKEHRHELEEKLRQGKVKAVVCLEGNSKILDSEGSWIKIKDIDKRNVISLNKTFKLDSNQIITKIIKENKENLIKLKTSLGKEIICTKEHKFLTINNEGHIVWKEAKDLSKLDYIGTIRRYDYKQSSQSDLNLLALNNYPNDGYLELKSGFFKKLKNEIIQKDKKIKSYWKSELSSYISYSTLLHDLRGKFLFRIDVIRKIAEDLNIKKENLWNNIINFSSDKYRSKKLEITENLMRLLGFMSAEGYISYRALYVSNKDRNLLKYYGKLIKKISGKEAFKKLSSSGTTMLSWESVFLSKFLQNLGFKRGRKSRINSIPSFVFSLPSNFIFEFLSGYLDGDGYAETKKDGRTYAIGFSTASKEMSEDIMRLLLREGIISSIRSRYVNKTFQLLNGRRIVKNGWFYDVVIIGGEHLRSFIEKTAPVRKSLLKAQKTLFLSGYSNLDVIPNLGNKLKLLRKQIGFSTYKLQKEGLNPVKYELNTRCISRKQLNRLLSIYKNRDNYLEDLANSDVFWEKIKSKIKVNSQRSVYNIEVKNNHNYIANGLITKNCSTSLELGIDIGYIDLVILLSSPKSVARSLQRTGRSGHQLHAKTKGRLVVLDRDDLVECAVLLKSAVERKIDSIHIPTNCLDVLAQQIDGIAIAEKILIKDVLKLIRQSYCYRELPKKDFDDVIDYLSGKFVSLEDRHIYAKIWYDEETGMIGRKGKMGRVIYMTNIGTIPEESFITVKIGEQTIGKLDESFLERLRPGDVFVLGGNTYVFKFSRGMVAQVSASAGRPPTVPSWSSESLPLSFDLAQEIGRFRKLMGEKFSTGKSRDEIIKFINEFLYVDEKAANSIYEYFKEQFEYAAIPSNTRIIIEHYFDGKRRYVIFHSLFGRRVNDCLSRAIAFAISRSQHKDVEIGISDNGFYIASEQRLNILKAFELLKSDNIRKVMSNAIDKTEVLSRRFRHCATRALMILRNYKGREKRVGRQQVSSMILMNAVKRLDPNFSILKEARREVLEDLMDIENTILVLKNIEEKKIKIDEISTDVPSPFAFNLIVQGYTDILKMDDRLDFVRKMHQMVMAKIALKEGKRLKHEELTTDEKQPQPFSYQEVWKKIDEKKKDAEEERIDSLKKMAWNLKHVPMFAKEEIIKMIDGETEIRPAVLDAIKEHEKDIKKEWPKELRDFVLKRAEEL